jgi:hypothetical protein
LIKKLKKICFTLTLQRTSTNKDPSDK